MKIQMYVSSTSVEAKETHSVLQLISVDWQMITNSVNQNTRVSRPLERDELPFVIKLVKAIEGHPLFADLDSR